MTRKVLIVLMLLTFTAEAALLFLYAFQPVDSSQDTVAVNEVLHSLEDNWDSLENYENFTALDYTVLDSEGTVLFRTKDGLSESIFQAVRHKDTILDITVDGFTAGKVILFNNSSLLSQIERRQTSLVLLLLLLLQWSVCTGLLFYLNRVLLRPFRKLEAFAQRIAGGNLDIPLEMDRHNLFGAFTESFDLMRSELKKARNAEAKANASKKELVAKLSHDIRTPVASIKATAEVGIALMDSRSVPGTADSGMEEGSAQAGESRLLPQTLRNHYMQIIRKANQINALVTDLFTAALEELQQLPVLPAELESRELRQLLENADYLQRADIPLIPDCLLYGDRLRLQQVFDNLFSNSYKYAGTEIKIGITANTDSMSVVIEDRGGGVSPKELPLLKEKFRRGSNAENIDGAGLGLYISDYFMKEMQGNLLVENGEKGLKVTVDIKKADCLSAPPRPPRQPDQNDASFV